VAAADRSDEFLDANEGSAADGLTDDDPEELFDQVKCNVIRGFFSSHALMSACLWVW
jgi:hypothetical protein